jgi:CRP/FNR family transcriptional regulator, anaerobic regulatory protein
MSSFDVLRAYLEARASFTDEEMAFVRDRFQPRTLRAGEFLQRAGEVSRHAAFVASGCLRNYVIDAHGKEHIVQFAPETWWLADITSLASGAPSQYFVDAIEDSELLLIDPPSQQQLVERVPGYAASLRTGLQKHAAAKDQRIVTSLAASAEERYVEFMERYPSIAQRVPQRMVASYLGVSPETISRVRKTLSRK